MGGAPSGGAAEEEAPPPEALPSSLPSITDTSAAGGLVSSTYTVIPPRLRHLPLQQYLKMISMQVFSRSDATAH